MRLSGSAIAREALKAALRARAERGKRAELAVEDYLVALGFTILAKNLRLGSLELDLVARSGPLVAVVEVRTRGPGSFVPAFASITSAKRARLLRAAERLWRDKLSKMKDVERVRIDVAAVTFDGDETRVEYAPAAIVGGDRATSRATASSRRARRRA